MVTAGDRLFREGQDVKRGALLFTVFFAGHNGAFGLSPVRPGTMARWDLGQVAVFVIAVWLVAVAAAAFSTVNERELRRRRFDLEALAGFAVALESASDRHTVAGTLLDTLVEAFPVGRVLLVTGGRHPVVLGHRGTAPDTAAVPTLELSSVLVRVQAAHQTLLAAGLDPEADEWLGRIMAGGRNLMLVPLHAEGGCVGVLVAEHAARRGSRVERRRSLSQSRQCFRFQSGSHFHSTVPYLR